MYKRQVLAHIAVADIGQVAHRVAPGKVGVLGLHVLSLIHILKALGFNLLRKHAKIEPQRWYYHCDRLGLVVWQDMEKGWPMDRLLCGDVGVGKTEVALRAAFKCVMGGKPVSYTHLDVYKRQA